MTNPQAVKDLVGEVVDGIGLDKAAKRAKSGTIGRAKTFLSRVTGRNWNPDIISQASVKLLLDVLPKEKHETLLNCLLQPAAQRLLLRYRQWLDEEVTRWGLARVRVAVRRDGAVELVDGASETVERHTLSWEFLHATIYVTRYLADNHEDEDLDPLATLYSAVGVQREVPDPPFLERLKEKRLLVAWARVLGPMISKDASGLVELDWREMKVQDLSRYVREGVKREEWLLRDWDPVRRIRAGLRSVEEDYRRSLSEKSAFNARRQARRRHPDMPVKQLDAIMERTLEEGLRPRSPLQRRIDMLRGPRTSDA